MEDKTIWQLSWKERYDFSLELAIRAVEKNMPTFICFVDNKYKSTIWNEAKKKVEVKKHQLELEYAYEK